MRRSFLTCFFIFFSLVFIKPVLANDVQTLSLKDYSKIIAQNKGKVIFVTVFATWCPACRVEIPNIIDVYKQFKDKHVIFIGLSADNNTQKLENFIKEQQIKFPVYLADKAITKMLNVSAIPHNVLYDTKSETVLNSAGVLSVDELKKLIEQHIK